MRYRRMIVVMLSALGVAAMGPSPATAACTSSTANSQSFPDATGEADELAPDISGVIMVTTDQCFTGGTLSLADGRDSMIEGEAAALYLDIDGNSNTGSQTFVGADRVVITLGHSGEDGLPGVGVWNASTGEFDFNGQSAHPVDVGVGGWSWGIDQIGFQSVTVGVYGGAIYSGSYDSYADFSPEAGAPAHSHAVTYSTEPPAQAQPQPQPTQSPQPQPQPTQVPSTGSPEPFVCKPGALRGLKVATARSKALSRGCDVKVRYKKARKRKAGRVLSVRVQGGMVILTVAKKPRRARRARAASAGNSTALSPLTPAEVVAIMEKVARARQLR